MRISAKSRYGLASMVFISKQFPASDYVTLLTISEKLGISKIYLEQVFSLLRRANLVTSSKGSQGGYQLSREPSEISVLEVLQSIETGMFEKTEPAVADSSDSIEKAMQSALWAGFDECISSYLSNITMQDLVEESQKYETDDELMFYI